jgi:hypothetical protein
VDRRLESRLDSRTRTAVVAIIDSARMASIPVEPLIDKALEGAAKRAPTQAIVSAVRVYFGQLAAAREALGASSSDPELIGGAQAIRAGVSAQQLGKLRRARSGVQIATALTVVSDMVTRLVPIDTAVGVVSSLVGAEASDDQLLAVRTEIEADIAGGMPPAVAASIRGHTLQQYLANNTLPNGAGGPGGLPSPSGSTNRAGDAGMTKPPGSALGQRGPAPSKPPVQRKRP